MEEEKRINEKLNCIRNEMTHLWGSVFIIGGGSFSLILNGSTSKEFLAGAIGTIIYVIAWLLFMFGFCAYKYTSQNRKYSQK